MGESPAPAIFHSRLNKELSGMVMSRRDPPGREGQSRYLLRARCRFCDSVALFLVQLGDKNAIFWGYEKDKPALFESHPLNGKEFISWLKQSIYKQGS